MKTKTRNDCWVAIVETLTTQLEELGHEPGEITLATMLNADLGISSVEAIHMMIMLEDRLSSQLSFDKLAIRDGEYVEDLSVGEILDFIVNSIGITA